MPAACDRRPRGALRRRRRGERRREPRGHGGMKLRCRHRRNLLRPGVRVHAALTEPLIYGIHRKDAKDAKKNLRYRSLRSLRLCGEHSHLWKLIRDSLATMHLHLCLSGDRMDKKQLVYHGRVIDLLLETVKLPNGAEATLEIVKHPGGAAAVAVDADGRVCLLRQYRHAARGWVWELPAGKLDPGEGPLATAQRELQEEAAAQAARWTALGEVLSSPGVFTEVVHLFLAEEI